MNMKKIIKLNESDLLRIIKNVVSEQGLGRRIPRNFGQDIIAQVQGGNISAIQKKLKELRYNLGSSGPNRDGIDGVYGRQTKLAVQDFQRKNKLNPDGIVGPLTASKLGVDTLSNEQIKILKAGGELKDIPKTRTQSSQKKDTKTKEVIFSSKNLSQQVKRQLNYMQKNRLLNDERFTILDDTNSKVHLFNQNYEYYKSFDVITGKNRGDQLKTQSIGAWAIENWWDVLRYFGKATWGRILNIKNITDWNGTLDDTAVGDIVEYIKNQYFNQPEWLIKNTPSGVFKRTGTIENFLGDWFATTFEEDTYGVRFISFETCAGETIPFGFHGTKSKDRLKVLPSGEKYFGKNSRGRKMSFGCINFAENDVIEVNKFITSGQKSIWLPDNGSLEPIPQTCL